MPDGEFFIHSFIHVKPDGEFFFKNIWQITQVISEGGSLDLPSPNRVCFYRTGVKQTVQRYADPQDAVVTCSVPLGLHECNGRVFKLVY